MSSTPSVEGAAEARGRDPRPIAALVGGVLAAIGASLCCVAPLVLVSLGVGGAWIGSLTALEPYRPIFVGVTLVFLFLAWRRLYRRREQCAPGSACAVPATLRNQRRIFWVVTVFVLGLITFPWWGLLLIE